MRNLKHKSSTGLAVALVALAIGGSLSWTNADTFISGAIPTTTWTPSGSPYKIIGNCSVASGQVLTIQPGVVVIFFTGMEMDVYGQILAQGSPAARITFQGLTPTNYWNTLFIQKGSIVPDSSFSYCNFSEATNAIHLYRSEMETKVLNCNFTNCVGFCVYAQADIWNLRPMITDCTFVASTNGVCLHGYNYASARVDATLANNLFQAIPGTAVWMKYGGVGSPKILNNIFKNCPTALSTGDAFDCLVENNVFSDCRVAVQRSGSLSSMVAYNCFFNNATNFLGYPAGMHGTICGGCVNHNGTPCDPLYNILVNPLFAETNTYTLAANSPCIDAGDPAGAYLDGCFPPSLGTTINDIGLYGGPEACGWISSSNATFTVSAAQYCALGVTINPSTPGRYRLEYTSPLGNTNLWTQLTNVVLVAAPFTYLDWDYPAAGQRYYRAVLLP